MLGPGGSLVGGDVQQTIDKLIEPLADILQMEASTRLRMARLTAFFKPKASTSAGWPSGQNQTLYTRLVGHCRGIRGARRTSKWTTAMR